MRKTWTNAERLAVIDQLHLELEGVNCQGLCQSDCTRVAFTRVENERLERETGQRYPQWDRGESKAACHLLTEDGKCSVYQWRPTVCRAFGGMNSLTCPHSELCVPQQGSMSDARYTALSVVVLQLGEVDPLPPLIARDPFKAVDRLAKALDTPEYTQMLMRRAQSNEIGADWLMVQALLTDLVNCLPPKVRKERERQRKQWTRSTNARLIESIRAELTERGRDYLDRHLPEVYSTAWPSLDEARAAERGVLMRAREITLRDRGAAPYVAREIARDETLA